MTCSSTDFPYPLSTFVYIVHHFQQIFQAKCVLI